MGRTTLDRMDLAGYSAGTWAEGIGFGVDGAADGWSQMLSSEFCEYVGDPRVTDVGVGISGDAYVVTLGAE